jgi:hypothetical protein
MKTLKTRIRTLSLPVTTGTGSTLGATTDTLPGSDESTPALSVKPTSVSFIRVIAPK